MDALARLVMAPLGSAKKTCISAELGDMYPMADVSSCLRLLWPVKSFKHLLWRTRMPSDRSRERPEKILVAMLRLSNGTTRWLKYEDIVVKAFELFPDEFALRGYPKFPDSSDVHKPLYGVLKRGGMVRAANKTFSLTQRGVETARRLAEAAGQTLERARSGDRMTRDVHLEVERMRASAAYKLHLDGQDAKILDTDFYAFLGCTVRTPRNDFLGRLASTDEAVKAAKRLGQPDPETAEGLAKLWEALREKFSDLVERRRGRA